MTHRKALAALIFAALLVLLAPPTFASGCGELCTFEDCEGGASPEEGCIERTFGCLDMQCYASSAAGCHTGAADLEARIDSALEGVDLKDREAVAKALDSLDTPLRYVIEGEVIYQSPGYELMKMNQEGHRANKVAEVDTDKEPQSER